MPPPLEDSLMTSARSPRFGLALPALLCASVAAPIATPTTAPAAPTPTPGSGGCPTSLEFEANGDAADLDTGWTGQSHDNKVINNGALTLNVTGCAGASPSCGQCNVDGPAENAGGTASDNHRCT